MKNLKNEMLLALSALPACTAEAFAREELPLPIIVIGEESGRVLAQADGEPYLEEYVMAVDVYAFSRAELDALAIQVDQALSALGFFRIYQQDRYEEDAFALRKALRYRGVIGGDRIYQ